MKWGTKDGKHKPVVTAKYNYGALDSEDMYPRQTPRSEASKAAFLALLKRGATK